MRLLTVLSCICVLAVAGCASGGIEARKGISLQEAKGLCITYLPGNGEGYEATCGGTAHHDICDTYMNALPDMKDRAECLSHCEDAWQTLNQRYAGRDCVLQVPEGKDICRRYCMGLP